MMPENVVSCAAISRFKIKSSFSQVFSHRIFVHKHNKKHALKLIDSNGDIIVP